MRIGIIGGSGDLGKGLSLRWAKNHTIIIGSRFLEKAKKMAKEYAVIAEKFYKKKVEIIGYENKEAVARSEIVVVSVPYRHAISLITSFKDELAEKILISPIVPLRKIGKNFVYAPPEEGSAALLIKKYVPSSTKIAVAFQNVSAKKLAELERELDYDVVVCTDDDETRKIVFELIKEIKNLRPLDGGGLKNAHLVEAVTPLILNIEVRNKIHLPSIKFVE